MQSKKAFTLIELMLVIVLTLIIATLAVHQFSLVRGSVRSEVNVLYQTCLYMQRYALVTRRACRLIFNLDQHSYTFNNRQYKLAPGVRFDIIPAKGPPASPTKILTKACTFKEGEITFYPDGIIESGSIYLTDDNHMVLYALTVAVAPYSYLRTYCYDGTWRFLQ